MDQPKKNSTFIFALITLCGLMLASCDTIDLYEKTAPIPKQEWKSTNKPRFTFDIKDTLSSYQLYVLIRHDDQYGFNNIWLNLYAEAPGQKAQKFMVELPLATREHGWLGMAMDELYVHRIALTLDPQKINFSRSGNYTFTLEQVMREDPLNHVFNVGLRLEKKKP
jgi:gliding motility-associated lipoprotein GldH